MANENYPCPICHTPACTRHLAGTTNNGQTLTDGSPIGDRDIVFGALPGARVYRRLHSPDARKRKAPAR